MQKNYLPNYLAKPFHVGLALESCRRVKGLGGAPYLTPPKPLTRRQAAILALTLRLQSPHPPACGRFPCFTHHHSHSLSLLLSTYLPIYLSTTPSHPPHPLIYPTLPTTPCWPHPADHTLDPIPLNLIPFFGDPEIWTPNLWFANWFANLLPSHLGHRGSDTNGWKILYINYDYYICKVSFPVSGTDYYVNQNPTGQFRPLKIKSTEQ